MAEKRRQRRLQRLFAATAGSFEERDLVSRTFKVVMTFLLVEVSCRKF